MTPEVVALIDAVRNNPSLQREYLIWSNKVRSAATLAGGLPAGYAFSVVESAVFHAWLGTASASDWADAGYGGTVPP